MVRRIISIFFLFFYFTTDAQQFLAKEGVITFFSEAPMENIDAVNKKVSAVYDSKTNDLVFQLEINDFVFPKSLMQEHFNENYLESDIYPKSIFVGKVISQEGENAIVVGDLTIHGRTKKIKVEGTLKEEEKAINISAEFMVKLEDYDIRIPRIVMYKIAEDIEVKVNILLKEKQ
jgi:polyisoprenoid-binding protein YceI